MRILSISAVPPYPPLSGGQVRIYNLLTRLARRHDVWLSSFYHGKNDLRDLNQMGKFGIHVVPFPKPRMRRRLLGLTGVQDILGGKPFGVLAWESEEAKRALQRLVRDEGIEIVQAEEMFLADYLVDMPAPVRIAVALDVLSVTRRRRCERLPWGWQKFFHMLEARRLARYESETLGKVHVIAMSQVDADALRQLNPQARVSVIPNGVDTNALRPLPWRDGPPRLLFVGGAGHYPNLDAIRFLLGAIWPLVRKSRPDAALWLVGAGLENVRWLAREAESAPGVRLVGHVDDIVDAYAATDVAVVPLRIGSGTRLKILEAMALGRPVVSTSVGCEGLAVQPGEHLLVADGPGEIAEAITRIIDDKNLRRRMVADARRLVEEEYGWDEIAISMEQLYDTLLNRPKKALS